MPKPYAELGDHDICGWFLPGAEDTCDERAVARVRVRSKGVDAVVALCAKHKQQHDVTFADARTTSPRGGRS